MKKQWIPWGFDEGIPEGAEGTQYWGERGVSEKLEAEEKRTWIIDEQSTGSTGAVVQEGDRELRKMVSG